MTALFFPLMQRAKHSILISGIPALSTQINMLDSKVSVVTVSADIGVSESDKLETIHGTLKLKPQYYANKIFRGRMDMHFSL